MSGGSNPNSLDDLLKELRIEYIASLPQKITTISEHLKTQNWVVLRDDFHKLKGTGKTYGIPIISELGEVVEKMCLTQHKAAPEAVKLAIDLLLKIYQHHKAPGATTPDPNFSQEIEAIRKLL